jgi:hypothetical protein
MFVNKVAPYDTDSEVEDYMWDLFIAIEKRVQEDRIVLLDEMQFKDFISVCLKYTSRRPAFLDDPPPLDIEESTYEQESYREVRDETIVCKNAPSAAASVLSTEFH